MRRDVHEACVMLVSHACRSKGKRAARAGQHTSNLRSSSRAKSSAATGFGLGFGAPPPLPLALALALDSSDAPIREFALHANARAPLVSTSRPLASNKPARAGITAHMTQRVPQQVRQFGQRRAHRVERATGAGAEPRGGRCHLRVVRVRARAQVHHGALGHRLQPAALRQSIHFTRNRRASDTNTSIQ